MPQIVTVLPDASALQWICDTCAKTGTGDHSMYEHMRSLGHNVFFSR